MRNATQYLLSFIRNLAQTHQHSASDDQLLESFLHQRDEEAFALLMQRHGSMVMGVCRRVLRHCEDAEDAFQATFLVLLKKAETIQPRHKVGSWLHGVATRTALETKKLRAKRQVKEAQVTVASEPGATEQDSQELLEVLDQQISRLPEKYRLPILLCDLQGKTQQDAAEQLGWAEGTVSGRLFRGRQMLAKRLKQQGLVVSATTLPLLLSGQAGASPVPSPLFVATMNAARAESFQPTLTFREVPLEISSIVKGVLREMWIKRMKLTLIVVLTLGISAGVLGTRTLLRGFAQDAVEKVQENAQAAPQPKGQYVHVALYTLKSDSPKDVLANFTADAKKCFRQIPQVRTFRVGSPAKKGAPKEWMVQPQRNYHVGVMLCFDNYDGMAKYGTHPRHHELKKKYAKYFDKIVVYDFEG